MRYQFRSGRALPSFFIGSLTIAAIAGCKPPAETTAGDNTAKGGPSRVAATTAKPYAGDDILLGEYGSMTGNEATFGQSSHKGIQMAVDEANAAGGVLNKKIRVQVEDDSGEPAQAATAVKKLINQNNVLAVLGEVASSNSLAAAPVCQSAGVPMISPTSTNPKVTEVGDYIFRTCFIDPFQGTVTARFAKETLKAKNAAILTDMKSDYSVGLTQYFKEEFQKSGKIVAEENFSKGDSDFRAQLTRIKGSKPDVIFIPGYYTEVGNIAKQARSLGMPQPMLGGDGWESSKLIAIGKEAIEGSYFSTHYSPENKDDPRVVKFVADFKKRHKGETPDALAAVAYDAARIMIDAIKRAGGTDRAKIRDAIAATKNFPGVTGNITIDENRNAVKPLVILQVKNGGYHYVTTVKP